MKKQELIQSTKKHIRHILTEMSIWTIETVNELSPPTDGLDSTITNITATHNRDNRVLMVTINHETLESTVDMTKVGKYIFEVDVPGTNKKPKRFSNIYHLFDWMVSYL